ncbi:unnamed protein product [Ilex paraguariensis]|uniref:Secreted protein n=1 Tax=Ilex paraguariensis TaxID=185542 RepID=A0ABC8QNC3_9AQUA
MWLINCVLSLFVKILLHCFALLSPPKTNLYFRFIYTFHQTNNFITGQCRLGVDIFDIYSFICLWYPKIFDYNEIIYSSSNSQSLSLVCALKNLKHIERSFISMIPEHLLS